MIKFVTGDELNDEIHTIIWNAKKHLLLLSPFIRLDSYFREILEKHISNENLNICIVFGKNEGEVSKSLSKDDFEFLKRFPRISVLYEPRLHAKYYANESRGVVTSINLHDHSFKNNIEFGIVSEIALTDKLLPTANIDMKAWEKGLEIAHRSQVVFIKRPKFQKKVLGIVKSYLGSEILHDSTEEFYTKNNSTDKSTGRKLGDYPMELLHNQSEKKEMPIREMPQREKPSQKVKSEPTSPTASEKKIGYCIRTGVEIPYNPAKPFSYEAFKEWDVYGNWEYAEKYCHETGQKSNYKTSRLKPILNSDYTNKKEPSRKVR